MTGGKERGEGRERNEGGGKSSISLVCSDVRKERCDGAQRGLFFSFAFVPLKRKKTDPIQKYYFLTSPLKLFCIRTRSKLDDLSLITPRQDRKHTLCVIKNKE